MDYPEMTRIRQALDCTRVEDIDAAVSEEMARMDLSSRITPGSRVAITAGSRGIRDIVAVLAATVKAVKKAGGNPFVIPAMGSHGGATAEGQLDVLREYGITEETAGAPIISSMEVLQIGQTPSGIPAFIDRKALEADHILVVNRIKHHTEFQGRIESGLMKMMVIGLGNHAGTTLAHRYAVKYGYERTIMEIGALILEKAPITLGLGIIENGFGQTAQITAIAPDTFLEEEAELLKVAKDKTPRLPFNDLDILIVDEAGKDISGTGMDTKVVGRIMNIYELEVDEPKITRIVLRALSERTRGNGIGISLADYVTRKVRDQLDFTSMYVNSVTAMNPEKGRLPVVCENDREAVDFAMSTAGPIDHESVRLAWIRNTADLAELFVSKALLAEVREDARLEVLGGGMEITFDGQGRLIERW